MRKDLRSPDGVMRDGFEEQHQMFRVRDGDPVEYIPNLDPDANAPELPPKRSQAQPQSVGEATPPTEIPRYMVDGEPDGMVIRNQKRKLDDPRNMDHLKTTDAWKQNEWGWVQNMGVSGENGMFYEDINEFLETHLELWDAYYDGKLSVDALNDIYNTANERRLHDGLDIHRLRLEVEDWHRTKGVAAFDVPSPALDNVASMHDDLAEVGSRMGDAAVLNTPDAANSLDEAASTWFDDMAQARGAADLDDAKDFDLRSNWIQGGPADDFDVRTNWIQGVDEDADDYLESVSDWVDAGVEAQTPANRNGSEVNIPQGNDLPADFDAQTAVARLDQDIERRQRDLARYAADPNADPSEVARLEAEIGARQIAKGEIQAGRDPRPTLYGMAEYMKSLGNPDVSAAYSDTAALFG